ncbi:TadE/TadG family type IV pilus assembly protein [Alkalilacustris brevis]|uniref:TadE/TadG family type IV pilus assembly protein n=1 Tax=Alkalilacustris brevis TaxID=2026338 RepID=UPI000E0D5795|nr:TadE/TadG family type IV pilus assembly protein [Alkalilacustris brevis]
MRQIRKTVHKILKRHYRDEDAAVTVEAVLWLPVFIFFFALIVDATMIMSGQAQALRVVQDANRGVSVGLYQSREEAESFVKASLSRLSPNAEVSTTVSHGIIVTNVVMPSSDLVASGLLNNFTSLDIRVGAQHLAEF